jgi:hypothetical protein
MQTAQHGKIYISTDLASRYLKRIEHGSKSLRRTIQNRSWDLMKMFMRDTEELFRTRSLISLRDQAPVVESYVDLFIRRLKEVSANHKDPKKIIDMNEWFNYFAFDLSGDLSFGESFDCLKNGEAHPWVVIGKLSTSRLWNPSI